MYAFRFSEQRIFKLLLKLNAGVYALVNDKMNNNDNRNVSKSNFFLRVKFVKKFLFSKTSQIFPSEVKVLDLVEPLN